MPSKKHVAFERLKQLRAEANAINYSWSETERFRAWQLGVDTAFRVVFGEEGRYVQEFTQVNWSPIAIYSGQSPDVWPESFLTGLERAKGILTAAIRAAQDYELDDAMPSPTLTADSSADASSLNGVFARDLARSPRSVRIAVLVIVTVAIAVYFLWTSLPDDLKRELFHRPPDAASHQLPPALANTPPTWVGPDLPAMALSNQIVVAVRNVSRENETAQVHLSIEHADAWHSLRVGEQYRFHFRGREYALTLLQVSSPQARVEVDAVL